MGHKESGTLSGCEGLEPGQDGCFLELGMSWFLKAAYVGVFNLRKFIKQ